MITALDHVALVVHDLDAATAQYQSLLGRAPSWRGADDGAAHAWFQLSNMALDVIAPRGSGATGDRVNDRLEEGGEGLWSLAFATADIEKTRRLFARRGLACGDARSILSTHVETGAKRHRVTATLAGESTHGVTMLLVERPSNAEPAPRSKESVAPDATITGLDHVVIATSHPQRAAALYGARLDLEMSLDRTNADWGARLMFFRCGDLIVEIAHNLKEPQAQAADKAWGLSWRAADIVAVRERLAQSGFDVSQVRTGRKPGTRVFTVRDRTSSVPTLVIGAEAAAAPAPPAPASAAATP